MELFKKNRTEFRFFILFFLFGALLSSVSTSPLIYPDEAGYIGWVYKILYGCGDGLRYLPGYSAMLIPSFLIGQGIKGAFLLVTITNSLFLGAFSAVCFKLSKEIGAENPLLTALAASLYPSFLIYANLALCETFLSLLFVLLCYSVKKLAEDIFSKKWWAIVVFLLIYMFITHSRAVVIIPSAVLALLISVWKTGSKKLKALFFSVVGVLALLAIGLFVFLLFHKETVNASHMAGQITKLFSVWGLSNFIFTLFSQFSYLVLSTFGFIIIGIYFVIKKIKTADNKAFYVFILLSFVFSALTSAVFMYHHEKPDHIIYGRYNEYVISALLLVGVGGFLENKKCKKILPIGLLPLFLTGVFYWDELSKFGANLCHTWGIYLYKAFFFEFTYVGVCVLFIALTAILFLIKNPKISVIGLCVLFLATSCFIEYDYFYMGASPRQQVPQLARLLEDKTEVSCDKLSGDSMGYPWEYYNYLVYNPKLKITNNAELSLSQKKLDGNLIGKEKGASVYLYGKGEAVDLVGRPDASVELLENSADKIAVMVTNHGAPWLCRASAEAETEAVRVGMRVYKNGKYVDDTRADFQNNVYDKESVILDFPYDDGEYDVIIETVREFLYRGGELSLKAVKKDGALTLSRSFASFSEGFLEFNPSEILGATGFYRYYSTGVSKISGINIYGSYLTVKTYGEQKQLDVKVLADGKNLKLVKFDGENYIFELLGRAKSLEIRSETHNRCDNSFEFLTTESNVRAVDLFVRAMRKVFNVNLDHRKYGVDIKTIKID